MPGSSSRSRTAFVAATAALLVALAVGIAGLGRAEAMQTLDVPSYWDQVALSCHTSKVLADGLDLETFRCRPRGGARPPAGRYTDATTTWYSDIDRRRARRHDIRISPSGTVTGWATY
jgi:hypothetical protein